MQETPIKKAWRTRRRKTEEEILESIKVINVSLEEAVKSVLFIDIPQFHGLGKLSQVIGIEKTCQIIKDYEGEYLKIPRTEAIWNAYQSKLIFYCLRKKYDRYVIEELAKFCGISEGHVRTIYQEEKKRRAFKNSRMTNFMKTAINEIIAKSEMDRNIVEPYGMKT